MKDKRIRNLIIMIAVLALLMITYFVSGALTGDGGDTTPQETAPSYPVADVSPDGVERITMTVKYLVGGDHSHGDEGSGGEEAEYKKRTLTLRRDGDGWCAEEYPDVPVDKDAVNMIIDDLNSAKSTELITVSDESSLGTYGLDEPSVTLTLAYSDGSEREFLIGDENRFNAMYYFLDPLDKTKVYMVDDTLPSLLTGNVLDFVLYDEVPKLKKDEVTSLKWTQGDTTLVYTYYPDGNGKDYTDDYLWYLSVNGGAEFAVDEDVAALITEAATTMSYLDCLACDTAKDAEHGLDKAGRLEISYKSGTDIKTLTLNLGAYTDDGYYHVRPEGSVLTYYLSTVASDNFEVLLSGIERKLRPDEIFYPDYDRVDGISFTAGDKTLSVALAHADGKITYTDKSGAELKYDAYIKICKALEELTATSYTSVYDGDASFGNDLIFKADFIFNAGEKTNAALEIRRYSEKYCIVSFMDRADQLVTLDKANALANLLSEYFK
jgi:hypothetical protein